MSASSSANDARELAALTAVVTGSSSGIGRAIAVELAAAGANCLVHGRRNRAGAEQTAQEVAARGVDALVHLADVADADACQALVETAWQWRGGVDIWVNNAGADVLVAPEAGLSVDEKLDLLLRVDVAGAVRLSRAIGERMRQRGRGVIINVGWDQAESGMEGDAGQIFAATKAAVMAFTRSLAKTLAPQVRAVCVAPGWIKTAWGDQASDYWQRRAEQESLAGRWGTPQDVARAVRFLASPESAYINCQTLAVNGGLAK